MSWPTDDEARTALMASAHYNGKNNLWTWSRHAKHPFWHSDQDAIYIAKACLYLGVPVTDTVTSRTWLTLIERVARLEERL